MPKNKEKNSDNTQELSEINYTVSSDSEEDYMTSSSEDNEPSSSDSSITSNKKIFVKKCPKEILTSKIRNMEFSISKI